MAAKADENPPKFPCRVEGWLNVWEIAHRHHELHQLDGAVPIIIWEPCFCVLMQDRHRLSHFRTEKQAEEIYKNGETKLDRIRVDSSKEEFDQRWGYTALAAIKENVLQHEFSSGSLEAFQQRSFTLDSHSVSSQCSDAAYEKGTATPSGGLGDRRDSVPYIAGGDDNMDPPSTPSRIASFFSKKVKSNLKRTKSVTKLDRRKGLNNDLEGNETSKKGSSLQRSLSLGRLTRRSIKYSRSPGVKSPEELSRRDELRGALINHRIRASRSHESLLQINTPTSMHSIDLSAHDIEIKPLHSSILGQEHCFQVTTSNGSKFYSCRSAEERQKWIEHLRKTVEPNQEQSRRTENSLKLWIVEAKNLPPKKKYYCELCLDGTLYARTSSKIKSDMLFWGEQFDFSNLPPVQTITVNLYKEADRKKKKEKNLLLAYININITDVNKRHMTESWHTLSSAIVGKAGKDSKCDLPMLRVKARYQTVQILPMDLYQDFLQYLETDYSMLVDILEPQISVKSKEEIAKTLVHIMQRRNKAKDFLTDIVMAEVDKLENENLTFRGNSIATKAMEAFLKLVGDKYLHDTLSDFVKTFVESGDDCEVDPGKVPNNVTLQKQQKNLMMYCEMAWYKIVNSHCFFPSELRAVFGNFREMCEERKRGDLADNLISSCIFLRFLCPAILSPSLFNLTQEFPHEREARNLTLVAKTVQCLANFTVFGGKEEFMTYMNQFVDMELANARKFIEQISHPDPRDMPIEFDGYIDLGKELSLMHSLLVESLEKVNDAAGLKLTRLKDILEDITTAQENPQMIRRHPLNSSKGIYDNVNNYAMSDNNANDDVIVYPQYKDANLSVTNDFSLDSTKRYTETLYSSRGRLRSGVTEMNREFHSTDDYVRMKEVETTPVMTQFSMSPSTYTSRRPEEKQVNRHWDKIVKAAEMVNGDHVDLITFVDGEEDIQNSSLDSADQVSVSQLSTIASSGYQSIGFSQSSSPVETRDRHQQALSFANPLFGHGKSDSDTTYRSPPQEKVFRSPSSSSLSSDDGNMPRGSVSSDVGYHTHPIHTNSVSSRGKLQQGSLDRRLRQGSSSSTDSVSTPDSRQQRLQRQCATHNRGVYHSPRMSISQPRVNVTSEIHRAIPASPNLSLNPLSRSVDLSVHSGNHDVEAGNTHFCTMPHSRRTPNMNIHPSASPSLKHSAPKSKAEYEEELSLLRQQLAETQSMLMDTQKRLHKEEETKERLVSEMHIVLQTRDNTAQQHNADKQNQIDEIMSRLHSVEQNRRTDSSKLQHIVQQKQEQIHMQEERIHSLDLANNKLMSALSQLKDRCHIQKPNGVASPLRPRISLEDNELKHSTC